MANIVVGLDGSAHALDALRWAVREAQSSSEGLRVVTSTARPPLPVDGETAWLNVQDLEDEARAVQDRMLDQVDTGDLVVQRITKTQHPWEALAAASDDADLLVIGSRGRGAAMGTLLGSVSHNAASHATCPVTIVPGPVRPMQRVVVAYDNSEPALRAAKWAAAFAARHDATVELVTVHQVDTNPTPGSVLPSPADIEKLGYGRLQQLARELGLPDDRHDLTILQGPAAQRLLDRAESADMLVVGSRGLGGFKNMLLGSVCHRVISHAPCAVTIVR